MLSDSQIERYARHILLREVGGIGQERLLAASVHVEGLEAAGQWLVTWLALAGVGRIGLADPRPVGPEEVAPLLAAATAGARRDEALAAAIPAFNPDPVAEARPPREGELRIAMGTAEGPGLRVLARGGDLAILPPGQAGCSACLAAFPDAPATGAAAARAGSMGAAAALALLLGREVPASLLRGGEPFRCPHGA